ncbi:hypothetical protein [Paenibacillus segetis]|uniref:Uncharacterized protein n=1 Tax=Paenibacillus segetis TaxID=1325360 RepID=A0ABQ1YSR8_9BACL|nr:hypothetical protein [Paenibacillus segetis]GGH35136.1 hypothetical protein GCM10008013_41270 [Paenibacillus segetis]
MESGGNTPRLEIRDFNLPEHPFPETAADLYTVESHYGHFIGKVLSPNLSRQCAAWWKRRWSLKRNTFSRQQMASLILYYDTTDNVYLRIS